MARDASTLPSWIPDLARFIYSNTGPYSDLRREQALHALFHSEKLKNLFGYLNGLSLPGKVWGYLIDSVANAVECVPEDGAATRKSPDDFKVFVRDKQTQADTLLASIASNARHLARLLEELDDLRATVPGEMYSSFALLESALQSNPSLDEFQRFRRGLCSYQRHEFPRTSSLLEGLAKAAESHQIASKIFANDAWLRTQKSSWRDFVRIMAEVLSDIFCMHGVEIELRETHWIGLVHALISPDISRSSVNAELRKLPPFSWEIPKK